MTKHDRAKQEKKLRNLVYARLYRQRICKKCQHKTSRPGKCPQCGGDMRFKRKH